MDTNGRAKGGRFAPGHNLSSKPRQTKTKHFARLLRETITDDDLVAVVRVLLTNAIEGEPWAVREFLDRACGKASQEVNVEGGLVEAFKAIAQGAADKV